MPAAAPAPMISLVLKVSVSSIVSGDDGAAESVAGALEKAAVAQGVVAVILMRDDRDDGFDHVVLDRLIDKVVPVVAGIAGSALVELRSCVGCLAIGCEDGRHKEGGVVEGVLGGGEELFLGRLWRKLRVGADGAEVWNDAEDAFGLLELADRSLLTAVTAR